MLFAFSFLQNRTQHEEWHSLCKVGIPTLINLDPSETWAWCKWRCGWDSEGSRRKAREGHDAGL